MTKNCGPRGLPTTATRKTVPDPDCTSSLRRSKPAYCPWHEWTFRESFPPRCPCSTPDPLATLGRMQDAGWAELGKSPAGDPDGALDLLDQRDTCSACLERGLAHPVVRRLRRTAGLP